VCSVSVCDDTGSDRGLLAGSSSGYLVLGVCSQDLVVAIYGVEYFSHAAWGFGSCGSELSCGSFSHSSVAQCQ